ncbi:MAG: hypothetical protein AAFQ23_00780 [Cyanobacteria bacterium J06623_1]
MTTIVKHRRSGNKYILLGINGETNKANPSRFISELFNQDKTEMSYSATVCDVRGNIFLAYIDDLMVIEIDGVKPADILPETGEPAWETSPSSEFNNQEFNNQELDDRELDEEFDEEFDQDTESEPKPIIVTPPPTSTGDSLDAPERDSTEDDDWI